MRRAVSSQPCVAWLVRSTPWASTSPLPMNAAPPTCVMEPQPPLPSTGLALLSLSSHSLSHCDLPIFKYNATAAKFTRKTFSWLASSKRFRYKWWIELAWFLVLIVGEACLLYTPYFYLSVPKRCILLNVAQVFNTNVCFLYIKDIVHWTDHFLEMSKHTHVFFSSNVKNNVLNTSFTSRHIINNIPHLSVIKVENES